MDDGSMSCTCTRPTRGGPKTKGDFKICAVCGGYYAEPKDPEESEIDMKGQNDG